MKNKCKIVGCEGVYKAKDLCKKHYQRFRLGIDLHAPWRYDLSPEERLNTKLTPKA
jgi:hypothetical protein